MTPNNHFAMTAPPKAPALAPARGRVHVGEESRARRPAGQQFARRLARACALALAALVAAVGAPAARAAAVDLELVLAVDVSSSVNRHEYALQMRGLAEAFRDQSVLQAIAAYTPNGVAVALLQWGGLDEQRLSVPWHLVRDAADAEAVAAAIDRALRIAEHGGTALGDAMMMAGGLFQANDFQGARHVIDVSGDGHANLGMRPESAREVLLLRGIVINGLAILNEEPELDRYYAAKVIGGEKAFMLTAADYEDFARAIRIKLVREIADDRVAEAPSVGGKAALALGFE